MDNDRPSRTADVSRYWARAGVKGVRLLKGPGYFCFEGDPTENWIDHTVNVPVLADLTFEQWLATYRAMDSNPANHQSVRVACR